MQRCRRILNVWTSSKSATCRWGLWTFYSSRICTSELDTLVHTNPPPSLKELRSRGDNANTCAEVLLHLTPMIKVEYPQYLIDKIYNFQYLLSKVEVRENLPRRSDLHVHLNTTKMGMTTSPHLLTQIVLHLQSHQTPAGLHSHTHHFTSPALNQSILPNSCFLGRNCFEFGLCKVCC